MKSFQFPSNGKAYTKLKKIFFLVVAAVFLFQFPSNGKAYTKRPYFKPSRAVAPQTQNQTRTARDFFKQNFSPKIPQTLVNIDPNAISQQNRLGSTSPPGFLDDLCCICNPSANRVWVYIYKYTRNLQKCQFFLSFFAEWRFSYP